MFPLGSAPKNRVTTSDHRVKLGLLLYYLSCTNADWVFFRNRLGHSSPNSPPSSLRPLALTRTLSPCLPRHPTTAPPQHHLPTFHPPPIPSHQTIQRPLNPCQKRSHDCRRHHKRTQGRYKVSTRTMKKVKPIGPSLSPPHQRNAGKNDVIRFLHPKRPLAHRNDDAIQQRMPIAHPPAPVPHHRSSYRFHHSSRSTQKAHSRRTLTLLPLA